MFWKQKWGVRFSRKDILFLNIFLIPLTFALLLIAVCILLKRRFKKQWELLSPFECGFESQGSARSPFSLHFFLVAILFLVFDLEIVLLFPLPRALAGNNFVLFSLFIFLFILLAGILYEYNEGALNWRYQSTIKLN